MSLKNFFISALCFVSLSSFGQVSSIDNATYSEFVHAPNIASISNDLDIAETDIVTLDAALTVAENNIIALDADLTTLENSVGSISNDYLRRDGTLPLTGYLNFGAFGATNLSVVRHYTATIDDYSSSSLSSQSKILDSSDSSFIAGGALHAITNEATDSVIVGGLANKINGGARSVVVGASTGWVLNSLESGVFSAGSSVIDGANHSVIVGGGGVGGGNKIINASRAAVVGGGSNFVGSAGSISDYSSVFGGQNNAVESQGNSIVGGYGNSISGGLTYRSTVVGGGNNKILGSDSSDAAIVGGLSCLVTNSYRSSIFGGYNHTIEDSQGSAILGGQYLTVGGPHTGPTTASIAIGGASSKVKGIASAVVAGSMNSVYGSSSVILGGSSHLVSNTVGSVALGGQSSKVLGSYSGTLGGFGNEVRGSHSAAVGGYVNRTHGENSVILGGEYNTITNGASSAILASYLTAIWRSTNSVILGSSDGSSLYDSDRVSMIALQYGDVRKSTNAVLMNVTSPILSDSRDVAVIGGDGQPTVRNSRYSYVAFTGSAVAPGTTNVVNGLVIGGGRINNSLRSATIGSPGISGPQTPTIEDSDSSTILASPGHKIRNSYGSVVVGGRPLFTSGVYNTTNASLFGTGGNTIISNSIAASIFGGNNVSVFGATDAVVLGGTNNVIRPFTGSGSPPGSPPDPNNTRIVGSRNSIIEGNPGGGIFGASDSPGFTPVSAIYGGIENYIYGGQGNRILSDTNIPTPYQPLSSFQSRIYGGWDNVIEKADYGEIFGGYFNTIKPWSQNILPANALSSIVGGYQNTNGHWYSSIVFGNNNVMDYYYPSTPGLSSIPGYNFIFAGQNNYIGKAGLSYSHIFGSDFVKMQNTGGVESYWNSALACSSTDFIFPKNPGYNTAIGTSKGLLRDTGYSMLIGGYTNILSNTVHSIILGGQTNRLSGTTDSIILQGSGVVGTNSNTAYIGGKLNVGGVIQPRFLGVFAGVNPATVTPANPGDYYIDSVSNTVVRTVDGTTGGYRYTNMNSF